MLHTSVSQLLIISTYAVVVHSLCGENFRWSHNINMDDVYGFWYGVGYAQHTPDMTNEPIVIGCVTIYISDEMNYVRGDWRDWSLLRRNLTNKNWLSDRNNPWSDTHLSGSWLDIAKRTKRSYEEKRLQIIWDEDGQTLEQTYLYSVEDPGIWIVEKWRPGERQMLDQGIDIWRPEELPRHPEVIRILKASPNTLIINHCSEVGSSGVISLIFRRSFRKVEKWEWYDYQRKFYNFELPHLYRLTAICAGCNPISSLLYICLCLSVLFCMDQGI